MKRAVIILFVLILLSSSFVFAEEGSIAEDPDSLNRALDSVNGIPLSGDGGRVLMGMSRDFFNIARYIVITALLARMLMLFIDFSNAGDNPQLRATIKSKSIWLSLGIIFAINFWTIYRFTANVMYNLSL